jgi:hypothetical protein
VERNRFSGCSLFAIDYFYFISPTQAAYIFNASQVRQQKKEVGVTLELDSNVEYFIQFAFCQFFGVPRYFLFALNNYLLMLGETRPSKVLTCKYKIGNMPLRSLF